MTVRHVTPVYEKLQWPDTGETFATISEAVRKVTGVEKKPTSYSEASTVKLDGFGKEDEMVFYAQPTERLDYTSNGDARIIENWEGHREPEEIGFKRHTFLRRRKGAGYEYLGVYMIVDLFPVPGNPDDDPHQLTLWERVAV